MNNEMIDQIAHKTVKELFSVFRLGEVYAPTRVLTLPVGDIEQACKNAMNTLVAIATKAKDDQIKELNAQIEVWREVVEKAIQVDEQKEYISRLEKMLDQTGAKNWRLDQDQDDPRPGSSGPKADYTAIHGHDDPTHH